MKKLGILLLALLSFGAFSQKDVMTAHKLWDLGRVGLESVSPDGKNFLYGITRYDVEADKGNRDLYLMSTDGLTRKQLTDMDGAEYGAQYLKDGKKIGFSHNGQYYVMDVDGKNPKKLTDFEGGVENAKAYTLSDGRIALLFSKKVKMEQTTADLYPNLPNANVRIIDDLMYRHWDRWSDAYYNHVCIAYVDANLNPVAEYTDLMEGQKFDSPLNPFGGSESFALSPDGKKVVYECKKVNGVDWTVSTNSQLYMVDLDTKKTTLLTDGLMGYDKEPQFSPDGSKLAWMSMKTPGYESDVNDLIVQDLSSGKRIHALVAAHLYDDFTFQAFRWADDRTIYGDVPTNGTNQIFEVDLPKKITDDAKVNMQVVTKGDYDYDHFEVAGKNLVVARQDINHATEIYRVNPKNGEAFQLTHANDDIYDNLKMSKVEKRMVTTSDGKQMLTWVVYPPDFDPAKKYPTLLYCQGGPQAQVSQFYSFRWNFQLMAAHGYIVVAPNRRGLPGFGRQWNEEISGDWGGQAMKDYLSAIDDVSKEPFSDEAHMGCVGASYGGYSVYYLAGHHDKRFKAFIAHDGLFDLENWYLTTDEMWFANHDLGGPYWKPENEKTYKEFDPKDFVDQWDTPILIIQGGKDFRVPPSQGLAAFQAAKLRGIPAKLLYFPEEGHWVLDPQNGLIWHDQFFKWLDKWVK